MAQAEVKLTAFCENALYNLENCSTENKELASDMLAIKAYASRDHLEIKGVIPQEFVTIEQTSGHSRVDNKSLTFRVLCERT